VNEPAAADRAAAADAAGATLGRAEARRVMAAARPHSSHAHLIASGAGGHVFVVDRSRLFDTSAGLFAELEAAQGRGRLGELLRGLGLGGAPAIDDNPPPEPPVHALSLAIAQKCNLGCSYCYARQGEFGGAAKSMSRETAYAAVDLLLADARPGDRRNLAFLGGEPLVNREGLQAATRRAACLARERGVSLTFSITTNGTLLSEADAEFFEAFGFAVTVSLDGPAEVHNALRPYKGGRGSFETVMANVRPLLALQRRMQVSARVTVTPRNLALRDTLDQFLGEGFHSVGFSPLLRSPNGNDEMQAEDLEVMLGAMIECGVEFERRSLAGERYAFSNMVNAMREIERGTHRPYPCGAGAGYLGVSADGELAACHRFVGDEAGRMGVLGSGVDRARRSGWLKTRHVHRQEPCRSCWARYLCGGGCHHEVISRGRPACDYIRGWLHYCIAAYLRLSAGSGPPLTEAHAVGPRW
jgi:uncharacterized protein